MKLILVVIIAVFACAVILSYRTNIEEIPRHIVAREKGFALVELFTSEGCSSCPAADELVARIQREDDHLPVYILAFHVDYWNKLGWKDVFSSAEYSKRQNDYANWLKTASVYTPQIVVNGTKEFVGSDEQLLKKTIQNALNTHAATSLNLSDLKLSDGRISLKCQFDPVTENDVLQVALVQKAGQTIVKKGENGGRTLSHVQIVRNLITIAVKGSGSVTAVIELPKDLSTSNTEVIAFLQNKSTGEIVGASQIGLSP